ncbi:MAG: cytochrome c [Nitrospira defluvii]|nr:cytochrome c [Nitrospira defluvii]
MVMKHVMIAIGIMLYVGLVSIVNGKDTAGPPAMVLKEDSPGFRYGGGDLTDSERAGAEIWFKATAGNERFFTYVYPQRFGVMVDWYRVLGTNIREQRFNRWGLINDPDCCKPGDPNCPAKSDDETYGFDYCPGDDVLLSYVGKDGYKDPACEFKDAALAHDDPHGPKDQRQSACDLRFGTSTGGMGVRKFPNPRFNKEQWLIVNKGRLGTWAGYHERKKPADSTQPMRSRIADGSIEPPFLVGISCGSCHIAFNPLSPPKNPAHPKWENLSGTVGNQYSRFSQILGSGMDPRTIEYQVFGHARPGIVDTSAIPNDQINNPGTINALINLTKRPTHPHVVTKWRKAQQCPTGSDRRQCWCEPGREGKCWERGQKEGSVHQILKGGEDSIGAFEAIQRVYFNIGSCSEESWVNHLTDMRQLDPAQRGFGQTPFDIGQARRDCPQFRTIEDRLANIFDFLASARPSDLYKARGLKDNRDLVEQLDKEFGPGSVDRGKVLFAKTCARCHSSQSEPFGNRDFRELSNDPKEPSIRIDWLGNDKLTPVTEVGTHRARALHSNHMRGHVWEEYGSKTLRDKPPDPNIKEPSDDGRGYYRNISLLSVWAHAPFMHNNAIGPELCGGPEDEHYNPPYVDEKNMTLLPNPPACWPFDPTVDGRFKLYKASMGDLLNPSKRVPKVTLFNRDVVIKLFPKLSDGTVERYLDASIVFPKGTPSSRIGNFRHKEFADDLVLSKVDFGKLEAKYVARYGQETGKTVAATIRDKAKDLVTDPKSLLEVGAELRELYSNSLMLREDEGHRFGEDLPDKDKQALIAFLATL